MLILKKIAVTGGVSSGKSTVCRFLREMGGFVVDADAVVHQLLSPDSAVGQLVVGLLGSTIVVGKQIDRKKIAEIVFAHPKQLAALEAILHPAVRAEIDRLYQKVKDDARYNFFAAEIPLLFEAKMELDFDYVIAVIADPAKAQSRSPLSQNSYRSRSIRQQSMEEKAMKADFTIVNNGTIQTLKENVTQTIQKIIGET